MKSLNYEERDALKDLFRSPGWPALLKLANELEQYYQTKVMKYNLTDGPEGLVLEKARAEGVASFVAALTRTRNTTIRNKS